jgi:hypothetical protein
MKWKGTREGMQGGRAAVVTIATSSPVSTDQGSGDTAQNGQRVKEHRE